MRNRLGELNEATTHYVVIVKGVERYMFLYDDASRVQVMRAAGRFASNSELSFTWYDASVVTTMVRQDNV